MSENWHALLSPVIIAGVPIVVMLLKRFIPEKLSWVYPILATVLGGLADSVSGLATGTSHGPQWGAVYGLAGVGLREIVDQVRKIKTGP